MPCRHQAASAAEGSGRLDRLLRDALIAAIRLYQRHPPARFRGCCLYEPSCSTYALQALERHGGRHGARLAAGRLHRCRAPFEGGVDPVP